MLEIREFVSTCAFIMNELEIAACHNIGIRTTEEWCQYFPGHTGRTPIDIEELCVGAVPSMLENVEPPVVIISTHRHVIRYDINDNSKASGAKRFDQRPKGVFAAQFGIDLCRIDNIVAMHRASACFQNRRRIEMTHIERIEIRYDFNRVIVGEPRWNWIRIVARGGVTLRPAR